MAEHPHVPAAFINAIREEGTKAEAIDWLQKTWNERCALSARVAQLEEALGEAAAFISEEAEYRGSMDKDYTTPAVPLLQKIQTALSEKEARG